MSRVRWRVCPVNKFRNANGTLNSHSLLRFDFSALLVDGERTGSFRSLHHVRHQQQKLLPNTVLLRRRETICETFDRLAGPIIKNVFEFKTRSFRKWGKRLLLIEFSISRQESRASDNDVFLYKRNFIGRYRYQEYCGEDRAFSELCCRDYRIINSRSDLFPIPKLKLC